MALTRRPRFSERIIVPLVMAMLFVPNYGRVFFPRVRETDGISFISSFNDPQMIGTYLLFLVAIVLIGKNFDKAFDLFARYYVAWSVVLVFILLSVLMSTRFMYSAWRMFELLALSLGALALNASVRPRLQWGVGSYLPLYYFVYLGFFCVIWWVAPEIVWSKDVFEDRLGNENEDIMLSPATLGPICGIAIGVSLLNVLRARTIYVKSLSFGVLVGLCIMSVLTGSRTGYIITLANIGLISWYSWRWGWHKLHPALMALLALPVAVILVSFSENFYQSFINFITRGYGEESLAGLSGRVEMWDYALRMIKQNPIVGIGYANIRPPGSGGGHLHNAWLELSVGSGIPAAILLSVLLFTVGKRLWDIGKLHKQTLDDRLRYEALVVMMMFSSAVLNSFTSSGFAYYSWPLINVLVAMVFISTLSTRIQVTRDTDKGSSPIPPPKPKPMTIVRNL